MDWMVDGRGHLIPDKIFRFEELSNVGAQLQDSLGFVASKEIGKENVSRYAEPVEELLRSHSEIVRMIEEVYYPDFFMLKYPKYMSTP